MRVVFPSEMKQIDSYCDQYLGLNTITLMDKAAEAICKVVTENCSSEKSILAICGGGNNGGDGLCAVKKLFDRGYPVKAFVFGTANDNVKLHIENLSMAGIRVYTDNIETLIQESDVILDCMFGIGFKNTVRGVVEDYIRMINSSGKFIVSVDIPSGVYAGTGEISNCAVKADITVALSQLKPGNVIYPGREYCGRVVVEDIGIPDNVIDLFSESYEYFDSKFDLRKVIKKRKYDTHKGNYGRVGIIAGSRGMTGAAILSAESALRSGAGLVYMFAPLNILPVYETTIKEAVKIEVGSSNDYYFSERHIDKVYDAAKDLDSVVIGPGLGTRETTKCFVRRLVTLLSRTNVKIILDADGINAFAGYKNTLKGDNIVITPHYGEFLRLNNNETSGRIEDARVFNKNGIITVLKGASTITSCNNRLTINGTGNPGMAVAGSGDVLSGIIATFATKMELYDAARYGALVHGLCGDDAKKIYGYESMISSDMIKSLANILNIYE